MSIFEPAKQGVSFDIFQQQWLARLRATESALDAVNESASLGSGFESIEDVVVSLVNAVGKLNTVVDVTTRASDYALSVGETAKITITAASTPLNIAVEDGVYEIDFSFDISTFTADQAVRLQINNAAQTGMVSYSAGKWSTAFATDEVDFENASVDDHRFSDADGRPEHAWGRLIIMGTTSKLMSLFKAESAAGVHHMRHTSTRYSAAAHTSLGTVQIGEAATGVCYVKRIA